MSAASSKPNEAQPLTKLVLVRHGLTDKTGKVLTGRSPGLGLSMKGREQAEWAATQLAKLPVAAVYASPIQRCAETAAPIAERHGLKVLPLDGLVEVDFGDWTGRELRSLAKTDLWKVVQVAPSTARFPGGESIREMQARSVAAIETIVAGHPGDLVVAVSHADVIKAIVAHFAGMHLDVFQRIWISPASCSALSFGPFGASVVALNLTGGFDELFPLPDEPKDSTDA